MRPRIGMLVLIAAMLLVLACALPTFAVPFSVQVSIPGSAVATPSPSGAGALASALPTQTSAAPVQPSSSSASFLSSFPLAPQSQFDQDRSGSADEPGNPSGSFVILSQSTLTDLIGYYTAALPKAGWTSRYVDANFTGGVNQYWKKDNVYLTLDFGYDNGQLVIQGQYDQVDPQAAQTLPSGFPLPDKTEIVQASKTSWDLYVQGDFQSVVDFYNQTLPALGWSKKTGPGGSGSQQGECGDTDCGSSPKAPGGAELMPTPTFDQRQPISLVFTTPDGNDVNLEITPHQSGALVYVEEILKNLNAAGLPSDVPIYPGALNQMVVPGTAAFEVPADVDTIRSFYEQKLRAAGWSMDGTAITTGDNYMSNWSKGSQKLTIIIATEGQGKSTLSISVH